MRLIAILFLFLMFGSSEAQTYQIGHTTITLTDSSRSNRSIPTEIYYPADAAGNNVPVTTITTDKFPLLSFGHGFVMAWDAYQNIWEAVVPEGFIIAFPKTETGLSPSHAEFGKDLAFVITQLNKLSLSSSSLFYNRIDSMNCVMGHSMGGGSAFLAAQFDSTIKSLATLAPAETNPSAIQAATASSFPSLVMAGGNDCVTPPPSNQIPMYDSLQSSCKTFISINGGSHCQMAESNFFCNFGESTCSPQPTISRADQHLVINRYLIPWLKFQLKGDCFAGAQFDSLIVVDASISYQSTCQLCPATTSINEENLMALEVFPIPFNDRINVRTNLIGLHNVTLELCTLNGINVASMDFQNVKGNDILSFNIKQDIPTGAYFLRISMDGNFTVRKLIKY